VSQYVGGSPADHPERYAVASPLTHVTATAPPTITVLGRCDDIVPVEQADLLDRALVVAGVAHETCLLAGSDHGFDVNWGGVGTQVARARIERFLRQHG
jgi:dipeptidyl aminopeptidase/acylaminoacyl peptidase